SSTSLRRPTRTRLLQPHMARKPATAKTASQTPPTTDYAQHNATYTGFLTLVRWTIVGRLITLVAVYSLIVANQRVLGTVLLLILPVGAVALLVNRSRSAS